MTVLAASMITKNEMGRYLDIIVPHLLSFCDEIRVLDDHSTDGTYQWLHEQERVSVMTASTAFFENEAKARNELLAWTIAAKPTYVLSIDADEFVGSPNKVLAAMHRGHAVYTLQMDEVWGCNPNNLALRVDGQWGPRKCPILWKAPGEYTPMWGVLDRKLACGREPMPVRRQKNIVSGSSVYHFGWTRRSEREARAQRYYVHDNGKFHKNAHLQSILWPDDRVVTAGAEWPEGLQPWRVELSERAQ